MVSDKKAYMKQWKLDNPKKNTISYWKYLGLKDDYDMVYNRFINSTNCENPKCNVVYGNYGDGTGTHKCMDHDHTPGLETNFRNILCCRCNVNLRNDNTSGIPNICKSRNGWQYERRINGKKHSKWFKYYYDAVVYKYLFEYYYIYNVDN
tara:strand:- start:544 stop:993 length:450 start_codon:yes stop_codon:yes gene_type:complete